ncbi:hypothetical protein [Streptomyces xanthophaeus]|uniref:hypothetical protein n=1 Tax=Streptomyces xanthophaeus TaxID=67385 RepID=UPI003718BFEA
MRDLTTGPPRCGKPPRPQVSWWPLVVHRGLEDLCEAPLSGACLALEVAGMRQAVLDLTGAAPGSAPDPVPPVAAPEAPAGESLEGVWSAR